MIQKAVISAAGRGTRMKNLSKDKPKHLIEVNGQPFLYYLLENLKKAGIKEMILVVGYKKELVEKFIEKYDSKVTILNQFESLGKDYGTACPIKCVRNYMGSENFISVCGDDLYSEKDIEAIMLDDQYNYVAGIVDEHPETHGVLVAKEKDFLAKIVEKPQEHVGDLVNTGMFKFTPEIFDAIDKITLSPRGEYEITDAVSILAEQNKVKIKKIKDYWLEFTKPEDVICVSSFLEQHFK